MAGPSDKINPIDHLLSRLSEPPPLESMPSEMLCPSGHRAARLIATIAGESADSPDVRVPMWVCGPCTVAYRFQECTLVPGEEGHA
jgi:hypothetical protein